LILGGKYEPIPRIGIWKVVYVLSYRALADPVMGDDPKRGDRRAGAAKRQAKYIVSAPSIGVAARGDRDKQGRRSKGPFARSE
jgi:hypothetical protein